MGDTIVASLPNTPQISKRVTNIVDGYPTGTSIKDVNKVRKSYMETSFYFHHLAFQTAGNMFSGPLISSSQNLITFTALSISKLFQIWTILGPKLPQSTGSDAKNFAQILTSYHQLLGLNILQKPPPSNLQNPGKGRHWLLNLRIGVNFRMS